MLNKRFVSVHRMPSTAYSRTISRARTNWQFSVRRQLIRTNSNSQIHAFPTVLFTYGIIEISGHAAARMKKPVNTDSRPFVYSSRLFTPFCSPNRMIAFEMPSDTSGIRKFPRLMIRSIVP